MVVLLNMCPQDISQPSLLSSNATASAAPMAVLGSALQTRISVGKETRPRLAAYRGSHFHTLEPNI
eukprot:4900596-Amphidinium_carterae.1